MKSKIGNTADSESKKKISISNEAFSGYEKVLNKLQSKKLEKKINYFLDCEKYDEAINLTDSALELESNNSEWYYLKVQALLAAEKYAAARMVLNSAKILAKKDNTYYWMQALVFLNLKKFKEAAYYYGKLMELDPSDAEPCYFKAHCLSELNNFEEALRLFDKAIELNPKYMEYYDSKAEVLMKLGQYSKVIELCNLAIKESGADFSHYINMGWAYLRMNEYKNALDVVDKAAGCNQDNEGIYYNPGYTLQLFRALTCYEIGRYEDALEALLIMREVDPSEFNDPKSYLLWLLRELKLKTSRNKNKVINIYSIDSAGRYKCLLGRNNF